jgi:hypothetical protein
VHKPNQINFGGIHMNKKTLLAFTLALATVGSASAITYASQDAANTTKNRVVAVDTKDSKSMNSATSGTSPVAKGAISDEEAIQMATKALKDYMGKDANFFAEAKITKTDASDFRKGMEVFQEGFSKEDAKVNTENAEKHIANVINVVFTPADQSNKGRNLVTINEETGELVTVAALYNFDEKLNEEIDDSKVKEAALNFFKQLGKNILGDTIQVRKTMKYGMVEVLFQLDDGREASISINAKDYSVINYRVNYNNFTTLPSAEQEQKENFKELQIR